VRNYKATPGQWIDVEFSHRDDSHTACILELRARVEALEAQAGNYPEIPDSSTPPPVATNRELRGIWDRAHDFGQALRAIYDLGVAHGQARSREVAEPAPVAGGLVERVKLAIDSAPFDENDHQWSEARAAILEVAQWMQRQGWKAGEWLEALEAGR